MKSWTSFDHGFLIECDAMEVGMSLVELNGVEELPTVRKSIPPVLVKFKDMFDWLEKLPQKGNIKHYIHLKKVTVKP